MVIEDRETVAAQAARGTDGAGRNLTFGMLDALGKAIVTGAYEAERFPTEAELARQHAVSRSVTREAVKMLTAKGLLTARPRTGTTVQPASHWNLFDPDVLRWLLDRKFSLSLLRQFSELRIAIEPAAAALAARRGDREALGGIAASYRRMEAAESGRDDALESDIAFHIAVLSASGNPFYMQFRDLVETAFEDFDPVHQPLCRPHRQPSPAQGGDGRDRRRRRRRRPKPHDRDHRGRHDPHRRSGGARLSEAGAEVPLTDPSLRGAQRFASKRGLFPGECRGPAAPREGTASRPSPGNDPASSNQF
jgi:DNA-binding FadR family transcriptional regulator